jgi:two-component system chemotaxis response regulator CheB
VIRVVLAEDSAVTREYLAHLLGEDPALEVAGTARDGAEAVEQVKQLRPDVVVMDVHMPRMDGYAATRAIMASVPTPIVMVSATLSREHIERGLAALEAGALTLLDKPGGPGHPGHAEAARRLRETVRLMSEVKVVRHWPRRDGTPEPSPAWVAGRTIDLVAIAASTGGPQVLAEILKGVPATLAAPLLVVQHIAPGFVDGLARWLDHVTPLTVKVAEAGEMTRGGTVYIAPEARHLGVTARGRIALSPQPRPADFCPSATVLFESVARAYGERAMGILLTGMGTDGAAGLLALRNAGAVTIAQDEESSVVFGMPAEAIRRGAASYVMSPQQIAAALGSLARGR